MTEAHPRRRLPKICLFLYLLAAVGIGLYIAFTQSPGFADRFNNGVAAYVRRFFSYLTVWIPFSMAEWLVLLLPVLLVTLIVIAWKYYSHTRHDAFVYTGILASILCVIWSIFVFGFAPGYYGSTLDQKLELDRQRVSAEELYQTGLLLSAEMNTLSDQILFAGKNNASVMPYSYEEMNQRLMQAYEKYCQTHDFPDHFYSRVKPVMLSEPWSYTHITGVYTFFTGEANINVNFPDYTIPYTAAHELAHQRGVAREDEANMIAFLVCMESEDPYIRYSALLNVYEYVASALYSADQKLYVQLYQTLPSEVIGEERAYSLFFEKYRENTAAEITEATNNAYLQSQGAPAGTRSYGMVVDLTVAYYRPQFAESTQKD